MPIFSVRERENAFHFFWDRRGLPHSLLSISLLPSVDKAHILYVVHVSYSVQVQSIGK